MSARPLQVALIGYGLAGKVLHAPLIGCAPGLELCAVVSRDPAKVHADLPHMNVVARVEAVLDDPNIDLVVIATPNDSHFAIARDALRHGKHVVVDKPFAPTAAEARALSVGAQREDRLLSVFHNRRWDSDFLTIRHLIDTHELGDIVHYEAHFDRWRPNATDRWRERPGAASGFWFDLGAHLVDQALCLFGSPDAVFADLAVQRVGAETTDYFHVLLRYGKRRVVLHGGSFVAAPGPRFILHGTHGSFVKEGIDPQEDALRAGRRPGDAEFGRDMHDGVLTLAGGQTRRVTSEHGDYLRYYTLLRDAISARGPAPVTPAEAVAVIEILELGEKSVETRRELTL